MSFNKNNPHTMGKIMDYLKQLSTEMGGSDQQRRLQGDEERLYKSRGPKYARVPSRPTLSTSTTSTSLATSCGSQATLAPNIYSPIPEQVSTESSSEDEQETFEKTRRHFQQLRQISLGNEFKYKMEMEIKSAKDENLRNSVPFVKQLSTDKAKSSETYDGSNTNPYAPTTQKLFLWTQILAALAVSVGSMIVGFATGYSSPALPTMTNSSHTLPITENEKNWVASLMPLAALVGAVCGGPLIEYLGRRNTLLATAFPFFAGWMIIANATSVVMVFAGRAICGICVGVGSLANPVYLGEVVQPEVRGTLGLLPTAFGNIGILMSYIAGYKLNWSELAFVGASLPIIFLALMMLIPETPHWYIAHGRPESARNSLQWLRGKHADVQEELLDVIRVHNESERVGGSAIFQLFSRRYMRSVFITLGLMLFQQLTAINAVLFYAEEIFKEATEPGTDVKLSVIIIGLVNFVSTFIATALIDRLGRKILLYISIGSILTTLTILGGYFYVFNNQLADVSNLKWIPLVSLMIFVLGFSLGYGPIPWLMLGEILPGKIRGTAAAVATAFNYACTFLVTKTFNDIGDAIGREGGYWLFAGITLIGLAFVIIFVPETKGKSLEEIERKLTGGGSKPKDLSVNKNKNMSGC